MIAKRLGIQLRHSSRAGALAYVSHSLSNLYVGRGWVGVNQELRSKNWDILPYVREI